METDAHTNKNSEASLQEAAQLLARSGKTLALTGAGVSTESGIPDFRSAGGLWSRYDPGEYATLGAFKKNPEKVWKMLVELGEVMDVDPNPGHYALAELENQGGLAAIITQNVDGLHQAAGSQNVVEFHGSGKTYSCLTCGSKYLRGQVIEMEMPPKCINTSQGPRCGMILKPDVVFFDEMIPPHALLETRRLTENVELILVIGTSCEVFPASEIPWQIRQNGGKMIEINLEPASGLNPDISISGEISRFSHVMPALVSRWREITGIK